MEPNLKSSETRRLLWSYFLLFLLLLSACQDPKPTTGGGLGGSFGLDGSMVSEITDEDPKSTIISLGVNDTYYSGDISVTNLSPLTVMLEPDVLSHYLSAAGPVEVMLDIVSENDPRLQNSTYSIIESQNPEGNTEILILLKNRSLAFAKQDTVYVGQPPEELLSELHWRYSNQDEFPDRIIDPPFKFIAPRRSVIRG